jgi:hypothetical protein
MKQKRRLSKREYVLGGLFVLAALLPLATAKEGYEIEILPPLASVSLPMPEQLQTGELMPEVLALPEIVDPS